MVWVGLSTWKGWISYGRAEMETSSSAKFLPACMVSSAWWAAEFCPCFCWGNIPPEGLQDSSWFCWTRFAPTLPAAGSGCQVSFLPPLELGLHPLLLLLLLSFRGFLKFDFGHQLHCYHICTLPVSDHCTRRGQCPYSVTCPMARPGGPPANQFNQQTSLTSRTVGPQWEAASFAAVMDAAFQRGWGNTPCPCRSWDFL